MKYVKLTFKILFAVAFLSIFAMLFLRMFFLDNEGAAKDIIWTKEAAEEYAKDPDNFKVYWFDAAEHMSEDGSLSIVEVRYLKNTDQLEFTVRYRDSKLEAIEKKFGSAEGNDPFKYSLAVTTTDGVMTLDSYVKAESEKLFYNYERLVFDGVDIDAENFVNAGLAIDYTGNGDEIHYDSLMIVNSRSARFDYDISEELPGSAEYETEKVGQ
ncbi:MAG: hypothetical protein E7623_04115 [Ruminococcaceae bacterium]|nr:hypothetical protein [Oscillospiraceae bacterium]